MQKLFILILTILFISCQHKNDKTDTESDERQVLNLALDKVIGSDTTFRFWLRNNAPPIPIIAFTNKIDTVEYLKTIHWRDSVLQILDTASLFVVVFRSHEDMAESFVKNLLDTIKQKKGDTAFNEVLQILCDQNLSKGYTNFSLLQPKYNFKIYTDSLAPFDPLRKIGSIHFSRIAFNKLKDTACIYTSFRCGEFCSKGDIHFLVKKQGNWFYLKRFVLWYS